MKCNCPVCKTHIEIDFDDYDEGDSIDCPECGELLLIAVKGGEYKLVTNKEKIFEELEETVESFDGEDD